MNLNLYNIYLTRLYIGILVSHDDYSLDERSVVNHKIVMKLGFNGLPDYLSSLPGKPKFEDLNCYLDSINNATYILNWNVRDNSKCFDFQINYIKCICDVAVNDIYINNIFDGLKYTFISGFVDTDHMMFIMQPDKASMMMFDEFKNCANEDLWFCSDWNEVE